MTANNDMTCEEAIRHLHTYSSTNGSGQTTYQQHLEAKRLAIDALEKQKPLRPGPDELDPINTNRIIKPCGNCGEELKTVLWDYCPWCGQKIKWR